MEKNNRERRITVSLLSHEASRMEQSEKQEDNLHASVTFQ